MQARSLNEWLALLEARHHRSIDLGLERTRAVWERMGRPRPAARHFTVAGTNGKGSTVAWICGMLDGLSASYGSYTSPHLLKYNERVRIRGREATDGELLDAFAAVEQALGNTSLTYYEFGTLAAFHLMAGRNLDYAVLEVGLGGRLDAVNILDADCAVITAIGHDHQEFLGDDLESIGREKAGIIRPGRPVVCGDRDPPRSVRDAARSLGAPLLVLGRDFRISARNGQAILRMAEFELQLPLPSLAGGHQLDNLATAAIAVSQLLPEAAGRSSELCRGLERVALPGRLQRVGGAPEILVDVGHNPLAALAVVRHLDSRGVRGVRCVIGMLADKDARAVAGILDGHVSQWYCAGLDGDRAQTGEALARRIGVIAGGSRVRAFDAVESALIAAIGEADARETVLVFGSFRTAADALRTLGESA